MGAMVPCLRGQHRKVPPGAYNGRFHADNQVSASGGCLNIGGSTNFKDKYIYNRRYRNNWFRAVLMANLTLSLLDSGRNSHQTDISGERLRAPGKGNSYPTEEE